MSSELNADLERRLNDLLVRAFELHPSKRRAFLDEHCAEDPTLLREACALLDEEAALGEFLEQPAMAAIPAGFLEVEIERSGTDLLDANPPEQTTALRPVVGASAGEPAGSGRQGSVAQGRGGRDRGGMVWSRDPGTTDEIPVFTGDDPYATQAERPSAKRRVMQSRDLPRWIGPYRIRRRIGRGGMGEVFLAEDPRLSRTVAIKRLLPRERSATVADKIARFRREARLLAQLNHPAVVQIYDLVEDDRGDSLIMELVDGTDLRRLLRDSGALPWPRVAVLGERIADGLAAAHAKGIIHRDLKAENILVTGDDRVKITDFGIAKLLPGEPESAEITAQGLVVGTFRSMSPEQARGEELDARTDLFTLGTMLYEMLAGRSPFEDETVAKTLQNVLNNDPPSLIGTVRGLPEAFAELVAQLLAKEKWRRPGQASEVTSELRDLGAAAFVGQPSPGAAVPAGSQPPAAASATTVAGRGVGSEQLPGERRALGERREVTVLCCEPAFADELESDLDEHGTGADLESTGFDIDGGLGSGVADLDPEPLLDVLPELRALAEDVAERFEGSVTAALGRRLILCFGHPRVHDDDAARAARAARELVEGVLPLAATVRVSLHSGAAVVTAGTSGEPLVLGGLVDRAIAQQVLAGPGEIVASAAARRRLGAHFVCEELPKMRLPGVRRSVVVSRVLGERRGFLERDEAPVVSRRHELDVLHGQLSDARSGVGRAALLRGDSGIGKSRLVRALREMVGPPEVRWWRAQGLPESQGTPFRPVIELLRGVLGLDHGASPESQLDRLDRAAPEGDDAALLAALLEVPSGGRYPPLQLGASRARRRTMEAAVTLLLAEARQQAMSVVVEDLHWADPSTLELLGLLIDRLEEAPLFLVLTSRPELDSLWSARPGLERLDLTPLLPEEAEGLIDFLVEAWPGDANVSTQARQRIVERAGGVPLYLEELTRAVLEGRASGRRGERIPSTLQGTLAARLDRLGTAKEVAQLAAVVGLEVPRALLLEISPFPEATLDRELEALVEAEILLPWSEERRDRGYVFRHTLMREAAYGSLLARERSDLHRRLAIALADVPTGAEATPYELLAYHCAAAGEVENAVLYWLEAGEHAVSRWANEEGIEHLQRGLETLATLPETVERDRLELRFLARLGTALGISRGYSAVEVVDVYARAEALCRDLEDDVPQLFWVVWGLWSFHVVSARLDLALELAEHLLRLVEADGDPSQRLVALFCAGYTRYFRGELSSAREALEEVREIDADPRDYPVTSPSGQDVGVTVRALLALVLWHQGKNDAASAESAATLELARRLDHPLSLAFALIFAARLHQSRGDTASCQACADEAVELSREKGFFWTAQGRFFQGCAAAAMADAANDSEAFAAALALQERGYAAYSASGARLSATFMLAELAENHLRVGDLEAARQRLAEAREVTTGGERSWEPELARLDGELAKAEGDFAAARTVFKKAAELANKRGDQALKQRAEKSLAQSS